MPVSPVDTSQALTPGVDSMWLWGSLSGERAFEGNKSRRAWNTFSHWVVREPFGASEISKQMMNFNTVWFSKITREASIPVFLWTLSVHTNRLSKIFQRHTCGKLTCKEKGQLMFSGLNTEDMAFPKTWLVSVLDYQYWNNLTARVSLPYNSIVCFSNRAKNITCELLLCDSHGPRVNGPP